MYVPFVKNIFESSVAYIDRFYEYNLISEWNTYEPVNKTRDQPVVSAGNCPLFWEAKLT